MIFIAHKMLDYINLLTVLKVIWNLCSTGAHPVSVDINGDKHTVDCPDPNERKYIQLDSQSASWLGMGVSQRSVLPNAGNQEAERAQEPCFNSSVPTELSTEEGDNVTLPCIVKNIDFNYIVMSWWKEGAVREISIGENFGDNRFSIDKRLPNAWALHITNASMSDSGVYICQINTKKLLEKFFKLVVVEKSPIFLEHSSNDVLVKDEAVRPVANEPTESTSSQWKPFLHVRNSHENRRFRYRGKNASSDCLELSALTLITSFILIAFLPI